MGLLLLLLMMMMMMMMMMMIIIIEGRSLQIVVIFSCGKRVVNCTKS
jgi:hypothetical protein